MKRVSKTKYVTSATAHTTFSYDTLINDAIKKREWWELVDHIFTSIDDLLTLITESYNTEDSIVDRI